MAVAASVDWSEYYDHIQDQCPWSQAAYRRGLIWQGSWRGHPEPLEPFLARVYVVKNTRARLLKRLAQELDQQDSQCEWLWSYPGRGQYATPVPVLIQQDRAKLDQIRSSLV